MSDDFRIADLDGTAAKKYLFDVLTSKKTAEAQVAKVKAELEKWNRRVALAEEAGEASLKNEAETVTQRLKDDLLSILADLKEFELEESRVRDQIKISRSSVESSMDLEALKSDLEALAGPTDTLSEDIKDQQAETALADIKKRLGMDS